MEQSSTVSIVIPVYNVVPYIGQCLESVCAQTYEDLDIIVVDDGSTDGSGAICDQYAQQDSRIRVFHQDNHGLSHARNVGIDKAQGDYIAFLDGDDWLASDYIARFMEAVQRYGVKLVYGGFHSFTKQDSYNSNDLPYFEEKLTAQSYLCEPYRASTCYFDQAWGKLYHKSLFEGIRFPYGKLHEDEFTTYKLFLESRDLVYFNSFLYHRRIREGSIMMSPFSLKRLDSLEALHERIVYLQERGYGTAKTELLLLYLYRDYLDKLKAHGFTDEYANLKKKYRDWLSNFDFSETFPQWIAYWGREGNDIIKTEYSICFQFQYFFRELERLHLQKKYEELTEAYKAWLKELGNRLPQGDYRGLNFYSYLCQEVRKYGFMQEYHDLRKEYRKSFYRLFPGLSFSRKIKQIVKYYFPSLALRLMQVQKDVKKK